MKFDFVIGGCCVLLMFVGALFGRSIFEEGFFVVSNIHDLAETIAALATVGAVVIAYMGINAWRNQLRAQSDHDLARRLAVALLTYKEAIRTAHRDAKLCINNCILGFDNEFAELMESATGKMIARVDAAQDQKAGVLALAMEARALWGDELADSLVIFTGSINRFQACVRLLFAIIGTSTNAEEKERFKDKVLEYGEQFRDEGWDEGNALSKIDVLAQPSYELIKQKLLR